MSSLAGSFNVIQDFGIDPESDARVDYLTSSPYWIIAVVRLGMPLSFSRRKMESVTHDVTQGALLRAEKPLVITDDCFSITVATNKRSHVGHLQAALHQTDVNYLLEILPGDWCLAWMVNNKNDFDTLIDRIDRGVPCNRFDDGLKFVGRIHDVRKAIQIDSETGTKTSMYNISANSFAELDSYFFYDPILTSKDFSDADIGDTLARLGLDVAEFFGQWTEEGPPPNNINEVNRRLIDLIVGSGPPSKKDASLTVNVVNSRTAAGSPQTQTEAPYAYLIPIMVGKLLGRGTHVDRSDNPDGNNLGNTDIDTKPSKESGVLAYADILELLQGVQTYTNRSDFNIFIPDLDENTPVRRITTTPMMGTFLPAMPNFANRPLWDVLEQYKNPSINEMFTTLRVNPDGLVMPTIVFRQIPYTTTAFDPQAAADPWEEPSVPFTRFLSLPRWVVPSVMIQSVDIGRSDSTRVNLVHVYGQSAIMAPQVELGLQFVRNPPLIDNIDMMRSGTRPYLATTECMIYDQLGTVPGQWMGLIADWTIGSHLTLNGSLHTFGIQSPIAVGDNIEFDNTVFHIDSVTHSCRIDGGSGRKSWTTQLSLTNGMRSDSDMLTTDPGRADVDPNFPQYPGFNAEDNKEFDPGLTLETKRTTGGMSHLNNPTDQELERVRDSGDSQLDPETQDE